MSKMKKLVVLTGAGISQESGLATFRDSDGLWNGYKIEVVASVHGWHSNKEKVLDFYNMRRKEAAKAEPNAAHIALAELEKDFDVTIVTQNVDDLHEKAGSTKVIHLHGELNKMCSSLDKTKTMPYTEDIKLGDKHEDGSQLRPFIVWFGEGVPMLTEAINVAKFADIFVVIGTSLNVYPAASLVDYVPGDSDVYVIDKNMLEHNFYRKVNYIQDVATEGIKKLVTELKKNQA